MFGPTLVAIPEKAAKPRTDRRKLEDSKTYERRGCSPISLDEGCHDARVVQGDRQGQAPIGPSTTSATGPVIHRSQSRARLHHRSLRTVVSRTLQSPTRHRARWERPPLRRC